MTMLAALWNYDGRPAARACSAMLRAQFGDDSHEAVSDLSGIALGRAVRNVAPADEGGPVEGASGALTLVADARLDNRQELLARLGLATPDWGACSDARLMMLCLEKWGSEAIDRFVGDFALALWDRRSERLVLARDFAGQRPLFFCEAERTLAVASMARGLHALDFVPRGVNEARLLEVLAGLPQEGSATYFRGIERVEPGEILSFRPGARSSRIFWSPPSGEIRLRSPDEYAEALIEKLDLAVAARLRGAGATIGTHLSAGLDSSAVTASAALQWDGPIHAFTSVPSGDLPSLPEGRFGNEGILAAETAAMYPNVEHRPISTGNRIPIEDLPWQLELFERSDLNLPNLAWANRINDAAVAAGIQVMLIGTMGNATISYGGFDVLRDFLSEGRFGGFLAEAAAARKAGVGARALLGVPARHFLPRFVLRAYSRFGNKVQHPAIAGAVNPSAPGAAEIVARYERNSARAFAGSVDVRVHMLRRVDPGSFHKGVLARWNIDLRDPTVDRRLVELCLQIPLPQFLRNGTPRALIRNALKGRVPESVRRSRERGLQAANWFALLSEARPEMKRLLAEIGESDAARRLLNVDGMHRLLDSWPADSRTYGSFIYRYGLLRVLSAGQFIRIFSSGESAIAARQDAGD